MRILVWLCVIFIPFTAISQCLKDSFIILERLSKCSNCNIEIESYINNNYILDSNDTINEINVCFELDSIGSIHNIFIEEELNSKLNQIIEEAVLSINTWIPAFQRNKPVVSRHSIKFRVSNRVEISKYSYISLNKADYELITKELYFHENLKNNSDELISHISTKKVLGIILEKLKLNKGYHNSLFKSRKSKKLKIKVKDDENLGMLIIPKLRYSKMIECINCKKFDFGKIPVDYEIYLILIKKNKDDIFFYIDKKSSVNLIEKNITFSQYSFKELNLFLDSLKNS